ncbi:MAG: hypothetical protein Q8R02_10985 [Hyphomonadaceae bacterium]|nr:hypothetical protein [Hyphomonadaceae bacterium]
MMINPKQVFLGCSFKMRTSAYAHLAQDAAEQFGVSLVFGDNSPQAKNIREEAFRLIATSRVVILDIVPDNVNVAVEYGFAKGCGKQNIFLLTRKHMFEKPEFPSMLLGLQYKEYRGMEEFSGRIEANLAQHYRKTPSIIDAESPDDQQWLRREIVNLLRDVGRATRKQIADALNCTPPDITREAKTLVQQRGLGSDTSGNDTVYFLLPESALDPVQ